MNTTLSRILNTKSDKTGFVFGNGTRDCSLGFIEGKLVYAQFGYALGDEALEEWLTGCFDTHQTTWGITPTSNIVQTPNDYEKTAARAKEKTQFRERGLDYLYNPRLHDGLTLVEFGIPIVSRPRLTTEEWLAKKNLADYLEQWRDDEATFLLGNVHCLILEDATHHVAIPHKFGWVIATTDQPEETRQALQKELYEQKKRT
jgi:hypothetical protein